MAPVIRLRPPRRARKNEIGAALKSVIDDVTQLERAVSRLAWGSTLCSIAVVLVLQALA